MAVGDWFSVFMRFLLIHGKWMAGPSAPALAPLLWVPPLPLKNYSPLHDGDKARTRSSGSVMGTGGVIVPVSIWVSSPWILLQTSPGVACT